MAYCSPDDGDVVQGKLDALSDNCTSLSEKCEQKVCLLRETADLTDKFYSLHGELTGWFEDVHGRIEEKRSNEEEVEKIKVIVVFDRLVKLV